MVSYDPAETTTPPTVPPAITDQDQCATAAALLRFDEALRYLDDTLRDHTSMQPLDRAPRALRSQPDDDRTAHDRR
jgi:hypothetical protein